MDYTDPKVWAATLATTAAALGIESVRPKVQGWLSKRKTYAKLKDFLREQDISLWQALQHAKDDADALREVVAFETRRAEQALADLVHVRYERDKARFQGDKARKELAVQQDRIHELERNQKVHDIVFGANTAQVHGAEWLGATADEAKRLKLENKWPHFSCVAKGQQSQGYIEPNLEDLEIPTSKVYAPNVVARPEVVQLLHVEGPYLTVKEQATHPVTKAPIERVFTVFDKNGRLRQRFGNEGQAKGGL